MHGLACRKNLTHRRMRKHIKAPRILLLASRLESHRTQTRLASFDHYTNDQVCPLAAVWASQSLSLSGCCFGNPLPLVLRMSNAPSASATTSCWTAVPCSTAEACEQSLADQDESCCAQETEHLRLAVARLAQLQPDVLLVEKSVARNAQEALLNNGVSLALNVKRSTLDRLARCTDAQVSAWAVPLPGRGIVNAVVGK